MDLFQAFDKARLFARQAGSLVGQVYFKPDLPTMPIAGKIWHVPGPNAAFNEPINLQILAKPVKNQSDTVMFRLEEACTFPERPEETANTPLYITFYLREVLFYLRQYEMLMATHGLEPVMGSEKNVLPNLEPIIEEYRVSPVNWPAGMALIGPVQSMALGLQDKFPDQGTRWRDIPRLMNKGILPEHQR